MIQKLIFVRHGTNEGLRLDDSGRRQMRLLAAELAQHVEGKRVRFLSSAAPRAEHSTLLLAGELDVQDTVYRDELWSDGQHPEDLARARDLIGRQAQGVDVLIVVTHLEYAETLPQAFGSLARIGVPRQRLPHGGACLIDLEAKTYRFIRV